MPNAYESEWIEKVLKKNGFVFVSQKGSHAKYAAIIRGKKTLVVVPANKEDIPPGTFHAILRQSGLSKEDFAS